MKMQTWMFGMGISALTVLPLAAHATTVNVGTDVILNQTQTETLSGGAQITLDTVVTYNSATSLYTYQYNLTNDAAPNGDAAGLDLFAPTVSNASDYGTSGLTFFFGGAESGGVVTVDGTVGNDSSNVGTFGAVANGNSSLGAYGSNARVDFVTEKTPIAEGSSNFSQFGDYFYTQSASAPGTADINVTDNQSADFPGPTPGAAPEPSSLAPFALGFMALLGLGLRARKSLKASA